MSLKGRLGICFLLAACHHRKRTIFQANVWENGSGSPLLNKFCLDKRSSLNREITFYWFSMVEFWINVFGSGDYARKKK